MFMSMLVDQSYKQPVRTMLSDCLIEQWTKYEVLGKRDSNGIPIYPLFEDYFTDIEHRYPLIFIVNGELAGFCLLHHFDENTFEIAEFFLQPAFRGQGYGRLAFEKVKSFCISIEKHPTIQIRCNKKYHEAKVFWQKLGFSQIGLDDIHDLYEYKILKVKRWQE